MDSRRDRSPERAWQIVVAILGAAAGFGLFVIALGAAVMWVRFNAAGLPAERGVGVVSKQTLAIVGVRTLVLPFVLVVVLTGLVTYPWLRWRSDKRRANPVEGALDNDGPFTDGNSPRFTRRGIAIGVSVFLVAAVAQPFEWFSMTLLVMQTTQFLVMFEVSYLVSRGQIRGKAAITIGAVGFALAIGVSGLAGQRDKPVALQPATVYLRTGAHESGFFVGEDLASVYLGDHGAINAYPHDTISRTEVRSAARPAPGFHHSPLLVRAFSAIFG